MITESAVKGLLVINRFVSTQEEKELMDCIHTTAAPGAFKKSKYSKKQLYKNIVPDWLLVITKRLVSEGVVDKMPDLVEIDEYPPGSYTPPHIPDESHGESVVFLSLGAVAELRMVKYEEDLCLPLASGVLVKISGELRYKFIHAIEPVTDFRYSIVFYDKRN